MRAQWSRFICAGATFLAVLLVGCGKTQIEWKEEVKLQSGEILQTRRTAISRPFGQIGGPGGWDNEGMSLEIIAPAKAGAPARWSTKFVPLIFDRDAETSEWFIVATFTSCTRWYELGRPKLPYTEFRFKNGQWVQQLLSEKFVGREGNMLTDIHSGGEPNHTLDSKQGRMNDPAISPEFKRVITNWQHGC
jgi:hypothetical protein